MARRIGSAALGVLLLSGSCWPQTFTGSGFSFEMPLNWYGGKLDGEKVEYAFSPVSKGKLDSRLSLQSFPGRNRTLRGVAMQAKHSVYMDLGGFVLEERELQLDGSPAVEIQYRVGDSLKNEIFCRVMSLHKDRLYIIQAVFPAEEEAQALQGLLQTFCWADEKETIGYNE